MTLANYIVVGKKLESIESRIYNMKNAGIIKRFEFAEKKYLAKRLQLKGTRRKRKRRKKRLQRLVLRQEGNR